jgi:hypothetical protein
LENHAALGDVVHALQQMRGGLPGKGHYGEMKSSPQRACAELVEAGKEERLNG